MAQQHYIQPTVPEAPATAVRLGASATVADNLTTTEQGKFVKLAGSSQYALCTVGQEIEGVIFAVELKPQAGWTIGSIQSSGRIFAQADGLQATPGAGTLAVGDIVVCGTPIAKGTPVGNTTGYPKVCKATTPANVVFKWRVVSLHTANSGAVGTTVVIERI
jgi:hypothetical protein